MPEIIPKHIEIEQFRGEEFTQGLKTDQDIYEGGHLFKITIDELVNNKVAIKQLINSNNVTKHELSDIKEDNKAKDIEINLLKITPLFSIIGIVLVVIGGSVLSIGVNMLSNNNSAVGIILIILGIISTLSGNIFQIIYPSYSKHINKVK